MGEIGKPYLDEHREVDREIVNRTLRKDSSMTLFPLLLVVCDFVKGKRFSIHGHHLNIECSYRPLLFTSSQKHGVTDSDVSIDWEQREE